MNNINTATETWLPLFDGFYESIYEPDDEQELEHINETRENDGISFVTYNEVDFDYTGYFKEISKIIADVVSDNLKRLDFVKSVEYQSLYNPREYNFYTDAIYVKIVPDVDKIKKYLEEYPDEWAKYLQKRYTGYDGFIPHYSNRPDNEDWTLKNILEGTHQLGSFLEFALLNEGINAYDIFKQVDTPELCYTINIK